MIEPRPFGTAFMGDGAEIGLPDELCVFGEKSAFVAGHRRAPYGTTRCQFACAGEQVHAAVGDVDADPITVADECERAADRRLRRYVADADAAGGAGEAAVGDERHLLPHLLATDDRRHAEHPAHPRTADRAFVAHDQHLAGLVGARLDGTDAVLLALEDSGRPLMDEDFEPGHLDQRSIGAEITFEHREAAIRCQGCGGRTNDRTVRLGGRSVSLGDRGPALVLLVPSVGFMLVIERFLKAEALAKIG